MEVNILSQRNIRRFKKFLKSAGRESLNLAITTSANQPIKGGMLQATAGKAIYKILMQKFRPSRGGGYGHQS
jgi:hypothetical protein